VLRTGDRTSFRILARNPTDCANQNVHTHNMLRVKHLH